jgi:hypothetical protein
MRIIVMGCDSESKTFSDVSDGIYNVNATFLRMAVDHVNKYYNKRPMHTRQLLEDGFMNEILTDIQGFVMKCSAWTLMYFSTYVMS